MAVETPPRYELTDAYHGEGLTLAEVADRFDVSETTVYRWFDQYEIDTRSRGPREKPHVHFRTDGKGYERWIDAVGDGRRVVRVHRLVAVAEYGFYRVAGNHVHHESGVPWDNRPDNLIPLTPSEHNALSEPDVSQRERDGDGRFA